jgi:adenylylsulfate reductase subunit A
MGRAWYPPWNSGSSAHFTIKAGAEMTCQEVRFIPVRFKDAYGPVGAWFLLFKSRATNAMGGDYMVERRPELENWAPYGRVKPVPANLRNYLGMLDVMEGKGPIYMRTEEAIGKIADTHKDDPKAYKKKMKELESEAWEDFLDMTISQALLWAATNVQPEEKSSEIAAAEPYFIGSHSGASGAWVSGPEDLQTDETKKDYFWGYAHMSTVAGLFCAGDASGASIKFIVENKAMPMVDDAAVDALMAEILKPLDTYEQNKSATTDPEINPNYMKPRMFMFRLQKIMDEYAAGISAQFKTNRAFLEKAIELLAFLKEDSEKLAAANLHELMRCWENIHRMWQAEAHVRTMLFREETRWPGYYFRADKPKMDEENWHVFANCKYDPKSGDWEMLKRPILSLFSVPKEHELLGG